jgi:adenylate kinase
MLLITYMYYLFLSIIWLSPTNRIGTILEMIRAITIKLVEQNLRVRISVQQSMGVGIFTGVPKQLNGVPKLLQLMDWQSEEGEENEGMVGNYLNFGAIGADHVVNEHIREDGTKVEQDDVFILIAPQSMIGVDSSIIGPLSEMADAVGDRPIILINSDLVDKASSQGQQNVRGRQVSAYILSIGYHDKQENTLMYWYHLMFERNSKTMTPLSLSLSLSPLPVHYQGRIDFADSFKTIWHFKNIYVAGTSYFPILGATFKPNPLGMWIAYQRRDLANNKGEIYVPVLAGEDMPQGDQILESFES